MCSFVAGLMGLQTVMQMNAIQKQADAQQQYYNEQAKQDDWKAEVQKNIQSQKADKHAQEQRALTNRWRLAQGQRNAGAGASGILSTTGSGLDLTAASNSALKQDSQNLLTNSRYDIWSSYVDQVNAENSAKYNRYYGEQAQEQAQAQKFSTLLDGALSIYGKSGGSSSKKNKTLSIGANQYGAWGI